MLKPATFLRAVAERPSFALLPLLEAGAFNALDDRTYLPFAYRVLTGERLDIEHPRTFNDKIAWLKLHDRKPVYQELADKYRARAVVADVLGEAWNVPLLGVWDDPAQIDFGALPDSFVLKCTHGYGAVQVCTDKASFDTDRACRVLARTLRTDFYGRAREWVYKDAEPRIIAEPYLGANGERPVDYKFMCMNGRVTFVCLSRSVSAAHDTPGGLSFFLPDGTPAPFGRADYPPLQGGWRQPASYLRMYDAAERLSRAIEAPFVRIDLYDAGSASLFSECTFYPCGGTMFLDPPEYNEVLGRMLELPGGVA